MGTAEICANSSVFLLRVAALLEFWAKGGVWPWLQVWSGCSSPNCGALCWMWYFFPFSRRSVLSKWCNSSSQPFACRWVVLATTTEIRAISEVRAVISIFSSFLCQILSEGWEFLLSVGPPWFGIASDFHHPGICSYILVRGYVYCFGFFSSCFLLIFTMPNLLQSFFPN